MLDLIVRDATLPDGRRGCDIAVRDGRIKEVAPALKAPARQEIDVAGCLVTPPFVDSHFHMDSALSYGQPRVNESGRRSSRLPASLPSSARPLNGAHNVRVSRSRRMMVPL